MKWQQLLYSALAAACLAVMVLAILANTVDGWLIAALLAVAVCYSLYLIWEAQ